MTLVAGSSIPDAVGAVMENYARRGVFRGYSPGKTVYKMLWHYDQPFELVFNGRTGSLRMPRVLPNIPADSAMYRALKVFIKSRRSESIPAHRRIDPAKAEVKFHNRHGVVGLTIKSLDDDYEYCARKLIHLVHEIYLDFLKDGRYERYLVETFNLDPDTM